MVVAGREQAPSYIGLAALMLVTALLEALGIGAVLPFLGALSEPENVLANRHVQNLLRLLGVPIDSTSLLLAAGAAMMVIFAIKGLLVLISTWLQGRLLHRQRARLSRALFAHYLHLPYGLYLRKNTAHLIHVIAGVTATFATAFMASVMLLLAELLICLTVIGLLLIVSPVVTGVAALFMVAVGGAYVLWSKSRLTRVGREQHSATLGLNKCVLEGLGALKEARVAGAEGYFLHRFDRLAERYTRYSTQLHVLNNAPRLVAETLFVFVVVGAVMLLAASGRDLKADLPLMALFGMAFVRLLPSFNRILTAFTGVRVHLIALHTLYEEFDETRHHKLPLPQAKAGATAAPLKLDNALELRGISYTYPGESARTLTDVSMRIARGEIVALVGKSGAGKTTLADVILGLLSPQGGEVVADGMSVLDRPDDWRRLIGYIPQSIYLTDDTIRRNIAFGVEDKDIDEAAVRRALGAAQLTRFVEGLKLGLDTTVGDRGVRLSGGQRQRIGIARALYRDPQLLVLDEATSALDVETESDVNEALRQIHEGKTLIVIAHRLTTVKSCDRLYLIDEGKLADAGTYAELANRNPWFRRINEILA
jgi:ATP-binding cassette subfamily C protein